MRADDECACSHVRDEHELGGPCQVDDCACQRFEFDADDEDE